MRYVVCAAALLVANGCTTVSIGSDPEPAAVDFAAMSPSQIELRGAVLALQSKAEADGWTPVSSDTGLQNALAVLLHGRDDSEADRSDPVEIYLEARVSERPVDTFSAVMLDIEAAAVGARRINDAAAAVIADGAADRVTLGEDVRAVERSIGVVRRARSLIGDAVSRFAGRVDENEPVELAFQLQRLDDEIGRMSDLADALNSLRLSAIDDAEAAVIG